MSSFSVLMSVYYKEKPEYLNEALSSIFHQTKAPSEIVIVKDGSLTKELDDVIDRFAQKAPVKIILIEKNVGLGLALNEGLKHSSNEIVARMDSDDIIPPDRFEKQLATIEKGYDVVSCWSTLFLGEIDKAIAVKKRPETHEDIVKLAKRRSPVSHAACLYRKSEVLAAGGYQHCEMYEDYHLWVRMILNGSKFYNVQESLYYVRTSQEQVSRRGGMKYLQNEIRTFLEFHKMGFFSFSDLVVNTVIRISVRLLPIKLRSLLLKLVWKKY